EAAATEPDAENAGASEARLVVVGNSSFATDGIFEQQLNGDVFLNSVSWLSQQDTQELSIRPKEATNRRILMTPQQQIISALTALVILPVLGFGTAVVVWLRRR
ncbi:MAG: ABC transporter, partial [Leptolyngbyaceae cyanobacterium RM1_405_57]|nr:ABC transporter [Leptolyngbyaceae cyanobacterium RM1_405_57]